ncbi:type 1 glutamine amidotransferase [Rhodobacteraceae bacterium]|nr:type 1 glutamine amidotransferase [Paracoccaceae bacterium]
MLIGILQCGHFPTADGFPDRTYTDLYSSLLANRGFRFRTWNVVDLEFPAAVSQADGWLITGSRHGAYEDHPFIPPLEDFIRACDAARVPMLGICFGHQIMAQALGGRVEKYAGGWSVGLTDYDFGDDVVSLAAWHQDQVVSKPEAARVLASTDFCAFAALAYGDHAMSMQPHPEFDAEAVRLLLDTRATGIVPIGQIETARANLDRPAAQSEAGDRIAHFFKEAHRG